MHPLLSILIAGFVGFIGVAVGLPVIIVGPLVVLIGWVIMGALGPYESSKSIVQREREAAGEGDVNAQFKLGMMYANGDHASQDNFKAYVWLLVAEKQGHEEALNKLPIVAERLTSDQLERAKAMATNCFESGYKECE